MTTRDIIKITLNLVAVYIAGGLILAGVYAKTAPVMFKKNIEEKQTALKQMIPEADSIDKLGVWEPHHKHAEYYIAKKGGATIGYIVESFGKGYSSYIDILTAVDKDLAVRKINILHHAETPGLGDEIEKDYFKNSFKGKTIDHLVVKKEETREDIQALSGATISSRAVVEDGVRNSVKMLKEKLSSEVGNEPKQ
jgi:electron transport complex protein RnfG